MIWLNIGLKRKESMVRALDHAADAGLMDPSLGVIIYICVGIVLEKWLKN